MLVIDLSELVVEAAGKIAGRYGRGVLGDKIREVAERRILGVEDGEEDGAGGDGMSF